MKSFIKILSLSFILATFGCSSTKKMIDKTIVTELDIDTYLGTWYEIARFDHRFERNLVGVTANYSWREDGKIKVLNSGYKGHLDGPKSMAEGKAKIPDTTQPAHLKVSFFWIFYSDYLVLELDKDYQWAVIGSSSDNYLWILSRTPHIEDSLKEELLSKISARGYNSNELIWVEQK